MDSATPGDPATDRHLSLRGAEGGGFAGGGVEPWGWVGAWRAGDVANWCNWRNWCNWWNSKTGEGET